MSNIINVKEERNVLSFAGEVLDVVQNSTNFYLKFELDEEWSACEIVTVIFDFNGEKTYVELDDERTCQIPQTDCTRILFSITAEPDTKSKLSSTILSLNVKESGDTDLSDILVYEDTHRKLLGLIDDLTSGKGVKAQFAQRATTSDTAIFATTAGTSQTQVSLTGDESIAGVKNFTGTIKHNSVVVPDASQIGNPNLLINGDFNIDQRGLSNYTRSGTDIYTVDRWGLFSGDGKFMKSNSQLTGLDETTPTIFCQWIEDSKSMLYGKTITVSATINGTRRSKTLTVPSSFSADYIENIYSTDDYTFRIYVKRLQGRLGVQFLVNNGVTITLAEAKLEVSDFETKYFPRTNPEETALCQRYYQKVRIYSVGYAITAEKVYFFIPLPTTVRGTKSFTVVGSPSMFKVGGEEPFIPSILEMFQYETNGIVCIAKGNFTVNDTFILTNGILKLDGEFY